MDIARLLLELLRVILERVLSWPVAAVFLSYYFREPISALIKRLVKLKTPLFEVDAGGTAAEQVVETEVADAQTDPLTLVTPQQARLIPEEELQRRRLAVTTYGGDHAIINAQIASVDGALAELHFPAGSPETHQLLVRHLAVTQLFHRAELAYRLIFGSQIAALRLLKAAPQPGTKLKLFYDRARRRSAKFYGSYTFEEWCQFLVTRELVFERAGLFHLSTIGDAFLEWLVYAGVPKKTH